MSALTLWMPSKGEFSRIDRVGSSRVDIHTGGIDAIWKECKRASPGKLAAGSPYIPLYVKREGVPVAFLP